MSRLPNFVQKMLFNSMLVVAALLAVTLYANRTFIARIVTYPHDAPISSEKWYQPRASVAGGKSESDRTVDANDSLVSLTALQQAAHYAEQRNSTALLISRDGRLVFEQYWRGQDAHSRTNSMSMAKSVIALLIGIAIADSAIGSEHDPAAKYLPEWARDNRATITLHHLLTMTSGLRNDADQQNPLSDLVQLYMGTDAGGTAVRVPAVIPPGQKYQYNNANAQVLGVVLERATHRPVEEYLSEKLWQPLGASEAYYWRDNPKGMPRTFCCFFATARDWLALGELLLNEGYAGDKQIVPAEWIAKMITVSDFEPDYGYQIWLGYAEDGRRAKHRSEPFLARDMFYLDGQDMQRVYVIPSYRLVIVRVGERPDEWDDAFLPNTLIHGLR